MISPDTSGTTPRPSAGGESVSGKAVGTSNGVRSDADTIGMLDREDNLDVVGSRTLRDAFVGIDLGNGR